MLYKLDEAWDDVNGRFRVQDNDLVGTGKNWIAPALTLHIDIVTFAKLLVEKYKAHIDFYYDTNGKIIWFGYYWDTLADARKFKNYINKAARENGTTVEQFLR